MSAIEPVIHPGTLYDYNAGTTCGVLVTEQVMRRLVQLQAQHLEAVKRLLADSPGQVFPSMWTLHYPKGEQTTVKFIDLTADLQQRIRNATTACQPRPHPLVFIAAGMDEAKEMADARFETMGEPA